jgi:hypothetical protein
MRHHSSSNRTAIPAHTLASGAEMGPQPLTGRRWRTPAGAASSPIIALVILATLAWGATLFLGRFLSG